jgi:hypothetical protein
MTGAFGRSQTFPANALPRLPPCPLVRKPLGAVSAPLFEKDIETAGARGEAVAVWPSAAWRDWTASRYPPTRRPRTDFATAVLRGSTRGRRIAHRCGPSGGRGEPDGPGESACPLRFSPERRFLCVGEEAVVSRRPPAAERRESRRGSHPEAFLEQHTYRGDRVRVSR